MESTIEQLREQLTHAELNAEYSLRAEGVVGEKFKRSQQEMTKRCYELVSSLRLRITEKTNATLTK